MFTIEVRAQPDDDIMESIAGLHNFRVNFSGVRAPIVNAIQAEHKKARLAGLDKDGKPMPPTYREMNPFSRWITVHQKGQYQAVRLLGSDEAGSGKPFVPNETGSRAYNNLVADVVPTRLGCVITAGYLGMPFLEYHAEGRVKGAPARDILGIQPEAQEAAHRILLESLDAQVAAASSFFGRARRFFGFGGERQRF